MICTASSSELCNKCADCSPSSTSAWQSASWLTSPAETSSTQRQRGSPRTSAPAMSTLAGAFQAQILASY
jgi:hypothetical protein